MAWLTRFCMAKVYRITDMTTATGRFATGGRRRAINRERQRETTLLTVPIQASNLPVLDIGGQRSPEERWRTQTGGGSVPGGAPLPQGERLPPGGPMASMGGAPSNKRGVFGPIGLRASRKGAEGASLRGGLEEEEAPELRKSERVNRRGSLQDMLGFASKKFGGNEGDMEGQHFFVSDPTTRSSSSSSSCSSEQDGRGREGAPSFYKAAPPRVVRGFCESPRHARRSREGGGSSRYGGVEDIPSELFAPVPDNEEDPRPLVSPGSDKVKNKDAPQSAATTTEGSHTLPDRNVSRTASATSLLSEADTGLPSSPQSQTHAADLWGLGLILFELYFGKPLFDEDQLGKRFEQTEAVRQKNTRGMAGTTWSAVRRGEQKDTKAHRGAVLGSLLPAVGPDSQRPSGVSATSDTSSLRRPSKKLSSAALEGLSFSVKAKRSGSFSFSSRKEFDQSLAAAGAKEVGGAAIPRSRSDDHDEDHGGGPIFDDTSKSRFGSGIFQKMGSFKTGVHNVSADRSAGGSHNAEPDDELAPDVVEESFSSASGASSFVPPGFLIADEEVFQLGGGSSSSASSSATSSLVHEKWSPAPNRGLLPEEEVLLFRENTSSPLCSPNGRTRRSPRRWTTAQEDPRGAGPLSPLQPPSEVLDHFDNSTRPERLGEPDRVDTTTAPRRATTRRHPKEIPQVTVPSPSFFPPSTAGSSCAPAVVEGSHHSPAALAQQTETPSKSDSDATPGRRGSADGAQTRRASLTQNITAGIAAITTTASTTLRAVHDQKESHSRSTGDAKVPTAVASRGAEGGRPNGRTRRMSPSTLQLPDHTENAPPTRTISSSEEEIVLVGGEFLQPVSTRSIPLPDGDCKNSALASASLFPDVEGSHHSPAEKMPTKTASQSGVEGRRSSTDGAPGTGRRSSQDGARRTSLTQNIAAGITALQGAATTASTTLRAVHDQKDAHRATDAKVPTAVASRGAEGGPRRGSLTLATAGLQNLVHSAATTAATTAATAAAHVRSKPLAIQKQESGSAALRRKKLDLPQYRAGFENLASFYGLPSRQFRYLQPGASTNSALALPELPVPYLSLAETLKMVKLEPK